MNNSATLSQHQQNLQHLFNRAGFGLTPALLQQYQRKPIEQVVNDLFSNSKQYHPLQAIRPNELPDRKPMLDFLKEKFKQLSKRKKQELNVLWLHQMAFGEAQLRERMTLFWHDHFACSDKNAFFVQQQNNSIRKHALGNFGELLMLMAKDAAMLKFLDNNKNRKKSPNENFARELLELFTLGIGNYTEEDIKEAARAFTGWNFDEKGRFELRERQHDYGQKTFMGKTGNWGGEDIIRIVLQNKQTAYFITKKVYQYFVNEKVNVSRVQRLAEDFYRRNYDISALLYAIFTANWFYHPENKGTKIKSPIELMVGLMRNFNIRIEQTESALFVQKMLGQVLLDPPNVAGWKGGKSWIDSATLSFRMNLPKAIFTNAEVQHMPKQSLAMEGEGGMSMGRNKRMSRKINVVYDAQDYLDLFSRTPQKDLIPQISRYLLQTPNNKLPLPILQAYAKGNTQEEVIQNITLAVLSLPEYQLC